jgi:hypothetical protein
MKTARRGAGGSEVNFAQTNLVFPSLCGRAILQTKTAMCHADMPLAGRRGFLMGESHGSSGVGMSQSDDTTFGERS